MRELFPDNDSIVAPGSPDDVIRAVLDENRNPPGERPWLFVNMVASIDGATATDGTSGGLGAEGDRLIFRGLRSSADIILVGGQTVRDEQYRPPQAHIAAKHTRAQREQSERPRLAVISGSLRFDRELTFLDDDPPPIIFHPLDVDRARVDELAQRADLVPIASADRDGRLSMSAIVDELGSRGVSRVLCEGGPSINGQLVTEGLVDEWNLTLAPLLLGGNSPRAAVGALPEGPPPGMQLRRVWTDDGYLFCRWTVET